MQFSTSIDLDRFLNLPNRQKKRIIESMSVDDLEELIDKKLNPSILNLNQIQGVIDEGELERYLSRYEGFWVQKDVHPGNKPAVTLNSKMVIINSKLMLFAEQKKGKRPEENEIVLEPGLEKREFTANCLKLFMQDLESFRKNDIVWKCFNIQEHENTLKCQGQGHVIARGYDRIIHF